MKKTLIYILSSIADDPKKIEVKEEDQNGIINFVVKVAKNDMGKVIGKNGKVIRAIRNVLRIPAIKEDKRINITLLEDSA